MAFGIVLLALRLSPLMPIQRTVSLPAPSDVVALARRELAPRYGAQVWDGPDRRVLLVRVPRREPDPVNDVEEAVDFLRPADVADITHCLLVADEAVAQVYSRPLQELMAERQALDRRIAASWRDRLQGLAHAVFQAPEDPRRRWRLAVRLPLDSVRDLREKVLEDLAEGMGAELATQRFSQIVAVYLIAGADDVRLEADMFIQELRAKWASEEGRRRAALEVSQREAEAQQRREQERRQILQEMEARLAVRQRAAADAGTGRAAAALRRRGEAPGSRDRAGAAIGGADARAVGPASAAAPPGRATGASVQGAARARDAAAGGGSPPGPAGAPLAEDVRTIRAHEPEQRDGARFRSRAPGAARIPQRVQELRARIDRIVDPAGGSGTAGAAAASPDDASGARSMAPEQQARRHHADGRAAATDDPVPASSRPRAVGASQAARAAGVADAPGAGAGGGSGERDVGLEPAVEGAARALPPGLQGLLDRLEQAGFEILVRPPTPGHVIDLAAERPEGHPQRIVVRAVERLDSDVAKELLKTSRELEVDMVLCVADEVDAEGERLLVASKVDVVAPAEVDTLEL